MPESVIPQNIHLCLMGEEDAPPPELDAFTFLNRLRALGIGSADFLYLLKGCDAPAEAIEKIEANPAMNLQMLIVTLEGSGLTPRDYTRMLYTARQLWERTHTMRLEELSVEGDSAVKEEYSVASEERSDEGDSTAVEEYSEGAEERSDEGDSAAKEEYSEAVEERSDDRDSAAKEEHAEDSEERSPKPLDETALRVDTGTSVMTQIDPSKYIMLPDDEEEPPAEQEEQAEQAPAAPARARGGLIAAACGAAVLFGASFAADSLGFEHIDEAEFVRHYAADNSEIFVEIYNAYHSGDYTADVQRYGGAGAEVFGGMLVSLQDGLGVLTAGEYLYSAEAQSIAVYESAEEGYAYCGEILPPEGAEFLTVLPREEGLTCVFVGEDSCGVCAYEGDGRELFTTEQLGVPTDIEIYSDRVNLATVYTPPFTESFTVNDTEKYLPVVLFNGEREVIPHERISLSGRANGCSYAVLSSVLLKDGSLACENTAALGRVLYSAAPELAAVIDSGEGCYIVGDYSVIEGSFTETPIGGLIGCDMGQTLAEREVQNGGEGSAALTERQPVFATAEPTESGTAVYLRGFDYQPTAVITNIAGEVKRLSIEGDILYICGAEGVLMAADISDPYDPVLLELTAAEGVVSGDLALCSDVGATGLRLTLYKRTEEGAQEAASFTRSLSDYERERFAMAGANACAILSEERCGAAYEFYDGVSFVTEFALFGKAKQQTTMFDESTGFTAVYLTEDEVHLIYGEETLKK